MRLDWAIPCASVRVENDGHVSAIEDFGFDTIWVDPFPSQVEFFLLIRAAGLPRDYANESDRTIEVHLLGPGLDPLLSLDFELPASEPGPNHTEGWELTATIPLLVQFTPRAEGTHSLDLYVHGRLQPCSVPFRIRAGTPR